MENSCLFSSKRHYYTGNRWKPTGSLRIWKQNQTKKKQLLNMDEKSLKLASLVAKWRCLVRDFGVPKNNQQPNGSQTAVSLTCCFLDFSFFIFFPPFLKLHWGLKRGGTWYNLTWQLFTFYDDLKRDRAADDPYPVHYSWYIYTPIQGHHTNGTLQSTTALITQILIWKWIEGDGGKKTEVKNRLF